MLSPVKDLTLLTELLATKMVNAAKTMVTAAEQKGHDKPTSLYLNHITIFKARYLILTGQLSPAIIGYNEL